MSFAEQARDARPIRLVETVALPVTALASYRSKLCAQMGPRITVSRAVQAASERVVMVFVYCQRSLEDAALSGAIVPSSALAGFDSAWLLLRGCYPARLASFWRTGQLPTRFK